MQYFVLQVHLLCEFKFANSCLLKPLRYYVFDINDNIMIIKKKILQMLVYDKSARSVYKFTHYMSSQYKLSVDLNPDIRKRLFGCLASPVWRPVN